MRCSLCSWQNFSKVSAPAILCSRFSSEFILENFCSAEHASDALLAVFTLKILKSLRHGDFHSRFRSELTSENIFIEGCVSDALLAVRGS